MIKKLGKLWFMSLVVIGVLVGFAEINYELLKTVEHEVGIGNTVQTVDGLNVELFQYQDEDLTFFTIEETETDKHHLTYVYQFEIIAGDNYRVVVENLSQDVVIDDVLIENNLVYITFSLVQEKTYIEGQMIDVLFSFELQEITLGVYTSV